MFFHLQPCVQEMPQYIIKTSMELDLERRDVESREHHNDNEEEAEDKDEEKKDWSYVMCVVS